VITFLELFILHKAELSVRDKTQSTPLHRACHGGAFRNAELLLQHGVDVNIPDDGKNTPLHIASKLGYVGIVNLLVAHNADQTLKNAQGLTAAQLSLAEDS